MRFCQNFNFFVWWWPKDLTFKSLGLVNLTITLIMIKFVSVWVGLWEWAELTTGGLIIRQRVVAFYHPTISCTRESRVFSRVSSRVVTGEGTKIVYLKLSSLWVMDRNVTPDFWIEWYLGVIISEDNQFMVQCKNKYHLLKRWHVSSSLIMGGGWHLGICHDENVVPNIWY